MAKTKDTPAPDAETGPAAVKARVLMSCAFGKPNDVANVTAEEAAAGQAAGELDATPEAVAYAEALAAG